ncbi:MAG TPA: hypothetical protein PKD00_08960, partial [Burkholderiales bacterium]|nr:hypothetical protein [Burkholderiales bacterium]
MHHNFSVEIATQYGIEKAIILENIYFWVIKNKANEKHFYDGYYWTYNSSKAFSELFPYFNIKQIDRIIKGLIDDGLIIIGNYNKHWSDRKRWFTLTQKSHNLFGTPCNLAFPENGECIPQKEGMHTPEIGNDKPQKRGMTNPENGESLYITDINTDIKPFISTPLPPKGGLEENKKSELIIEEQTNAKVNKPKIPKPDFNYDGFNEIDKNAIEEWFAYRQEIGKPYKSQRGLSRLRNTLLELKESNCIIEAINQSLAAEYRG